MKTEIKNRTISESTAKFIECLESTTELYGQFRDALLSMYHETDVDDIIYKRFTDPFQKLESVIESFLTVGRLIQRKYRK